MFRYLAIDGMLNGTGNREVVLQISENMYLQYFVGLSGFRAEPSFDASLLVTIRKRLGHEAVEELNEIFLRQAGILMYRPLIIWTVF